MTEPSDWAKQLADEKLRQRDKKQVEEDKVLSDKRLVQSRAPEMWEQFKNEVVKCLTELKVAMRGEDALRLQTETDRLSLRNPKSGMEIVGMPFHKESGEMPTIWGEYVLFPYGTNDVVWLEKKSHTHMTTDDVARSIVQMAFRQVS
jgi:hypothetical protein